MKITEDNKKSIKIMRASGNTIENIAEHFKVSLSTIQYHLSDKTRLRVIEKSKINQKGKKREPRTDYMRNYQKKRREDPIYAEKTRIYNRDRWRELNKKSTE